MVLAMRMLRLSGPEMDGLDEVVPLTNLKDRFARAENATRLPVPPNSVLVSWTGIAPPKGQWAVRDRISGNEIRSTAEAGVEEISSGAPEGAGSHAVKALRSRVWSKPMAAHDGTELPGGLAFAANALRFSYPRSRGPPRRGSPRNMTSSRRPAGCGSRHRAVIC